MQQFQQSRPGITNKEPFREVALWIIERDPERRIEDWFKQLENKLTVLKPQFNGTTPEGRKRFEKDLQKLSSEYKDLEVQSTNAERRKTAKSRQNEIRDLLKKINTDFVI